MQIHVIQRGQTLQGIAQAYNTTSTTIIDANEIPNPDALVVGQTLVIPIVGSYYWVNAGDTLFSIAEKHETSAEELAKVNGISFNQILNIGSRIYIPPKKKRRAEFNGYIESRDTRSVEALVSAVTEAEPYITYLTPFSFQALRDGSLKEPLLNEFPVRANRNFFMITNLENGKFNTELGRILLNDLTIQNRFLNNIEATAKKYGYRGIHFDFEFLRPADREPYNQFLRNAKAHFSEEGWLLSTALAPKTSAAQKGEWYEAHDYKAHGQICDFVVIMSYEWGNSNGPAMAVSPIGPVRQVLEYAISEIPPKKILMGQNLYGYDWTLPFVDSKNAKMVSPQQAIQLASSKKVSIQYDYEVEAPFFHYTTEDGKRHEVWFEDARSIQAKLNLIKEYGLRGASFWKLGFSFPQNWLLINENFNITNRT